MLSIYSEPKQYVMLNVCGRLFLFLFSITSAALIDNTKARRDVTGALMDVHDGNVVRWNNEDELYYWYGMGYQDCQLEKGLIPPRNCPGIYQEFGGSPKVKKKCSINFWIFTSEHNF